MSMFRRKDEIDGIEGAETESTATEGMASPTPLSAAPAPQAAAAPKPANPVAPSAASPMPQAPTAAMPAAPAGMARPAAAPAAPGFRPAAAMTPAVGSPSKPAAAPSPMSPASKTGGKRILTVGNDILLKGEIATCDRLVIEGSVDAKLNDVHTVEIAETGSFKGTAEIEDAEISGLFEGELTVRNRLTIYSTGKVRGTISYGEIEIERGGQLTGTITNANAAPATKEKSKAA